MAEWSKLESLNSTRTTHYIYRYLLKKNFEIKLKKKKKKQMNRVELENKHFKMKK